MNSLNSPVLSTIDSDYPQSTTKILVAESTGFSADAIANIRRFGDVQLEDLDRKGLIKKIESADVLWVRLRNRIDQEMLSAAKRLKMIVTPTTGLNHIDLEAAAAQGIRVLSLKGEADFLKVVRATAELTLGLMLALLRRIPNASNHVVNGEWNRDCFRGEELCGKTVGIVGFGRLGKIVAHYLAAFDASVLVTDPNVEEDSLPSNVRLVALNRLLAESDIVSIHVNFTEENRCFFSSSQFAMMKPGSWFINTARGELIDEAALETALRSKHLAGGALDVLAQEDSTGMREHPLVVYAMNHDNLLITPHIGGCTIESLAKTENFMAEQFCELWPSIVEWNRP